MNLLKYLQSGLIADDGLGEVRRSISCGQVAIGSAQVVLRHGPIHMQASKADLVERLLEVEQEYAQTLQQLARLKFAPATQEISLSADEK